MAYTINRTDGTLFATVADGTIDNTTSLIIIGKNYAGYGEAQNENFVRLLENHANATEPTNPQTGQLWYNSNDGLLTVYNGTAFKDLGALSADATAPVSSVPGDMWFDTANSQLSVYDGTDYILVGPAFSSGAGTSGSIVETITDNLDAEHVLIKLYVSNELVAVVSKDTEFTIKAGEELTGFASTIKPGIQLANNVGAALPLFVGKATDSELLDGIDSTGFLSSTVNDTTAGTLGVLNDAGLTVGADADAKISVLTDDVVFENVTADGDIRFDVNDGGVATTVITLDGATARARVEAPIAATDIVNKNYTDTTFVELTGDTVTGQIKGIAPVSAEDLTRKDYVDDLVSGYTALANNSTVVNLNSAPSQSVTLTGNVSLTSSNIAAGRKVDVFFLASGADRTVTLNASWNSYGEVSPIVIPSGKSLVLSLTALGSTESTVHCAAVLEN